MTFKNILLTIAGVLLLAVGTIGIFFPILPTTPFVLASLACFSGMPAIRGRLLKIKIISDYYNNYKNRCGLPKSSVIFTLGFLWITLAASMIWIHKLWSFLLLPGVGIAVTIHVLYMAKPRKPAAAESEKKDE